MRARILTRQHRGGALGADRHHDRRTVHDGRGDEGGEVGRVDDVDGNAARRCRPGDCGIERPVAGRDVDKPPAPHVVGAEGAPQQLDGPALAQGVQLIADGRGHHGDAGVRLAQEAYLLRRLLAAPDNEDVGAVQIGEHGEIAHGDLASRATDSEVANRRSCRWLVPGTGTCVGGPQQGK